MKYPEQAVTQACNPAARVAEVEAAERALGAPIPSELRARYLVYNGVPEYQARYMPFRLMPLKEVLEIRDLADGFHVGNLMRKYDIVFFWCDDESNYAGTAITGPLTGYVMQLAHDRGGLYDNLNPVMRSFEPFAEQIRRGAERNLIVQAAEEEDWDDDELDERLAPFVADFPYCECDEYADASMFQFEYPSRNRFCERDHHAHAWLEARWQAKEERVEMEDEFLLEALAFLCPPNQWTALVKHFDRVPSVAQILATKYFREMLPNLVSMTKTENRSGPDPFSMLAKGVFLQPETESEVQACLMRQGVNRSYFADALDQIRRWPSLTLQW